MLILSSNIRRCKKQQKQKHYPYVQMFKISVISKYDKILTIVISQQLLIHGFRLCYSEERKSTLECIKICHSSYDLIYISLRNDLLCKWHYWKWATHTFQFPKVTKYVVDRVQNLTWFFSWIKHQSTLFLIQLSV